MNIAVKVDAAEAAAEAYATPLAKLNPAKVERFRDDTIWPVFERLRAEDSRPLHARERVRTLLVGHQVERHHGGRHRP